MSGVLLDTNAYVAFKRGRPEAVEILEQATRIALNSTVLGELLSGFAIGNRETRNIRELQEFVDSGSVELLAVDSDTATHYAAIYRELRNGGHPIPTNDMWIAASARQHAFALFTYDKHFAHITGLPSGTSVAELNLT